MRFRTSRETDRGVDQDVAGETDVTVFENRRALPRAWLVGEIVPMPDDQAIGTIKSSRLPDGRRFDAATMAVVDSSAPPPASHFTPSASRFAPGASNVIVDRIGDGDIGIRVSSEGASFLVLSENAYPGWRARVDGAEVPISRADVTLQGIVVPAGTHRVEFMLESRSLRAGMFVTGGAALAILALLIV